MAHGKMIRLSSWFAILATLASVPIGLLVLVLIEKSFFDIGNHTAAIFALPFLLAVLVLFVWQAVQQKLVWVDERSLHVTTLLKGTNIPLTSVDRVDESVFRAVVIVRLKTESIFGSTITFRPNLPFNVFFGPHYVTEELRDLVHKASSQTMGAI